MCVSACVAKCTVVWRNVITINRDKWLAHDEHCWVDEDLRYYLDAMDKEDYEDGYNTAKKGQKIINRIRKRCSDCKAGVRPYLDNCVCWSQTNGSPRLWIPNDDLPDNLTVTYEYIDLTEWFPNIGYCMNKNRWKREDGRQLSLRRRGAVGETRDGHSD